MLVLNRQALGDRFRRIGTGPDGHGYRSMSELLSLRKEAEQAGLMGTAQHIPHQPDTERMMRDVHRAAKEWIPQRRGELDCVVNPMQARESMLEDQIESMQHPKASRGADHAQKLRDRKAELERLRENLTATEVLQAAERAGLRKLNDLLGTSLEKVQSNLARHELQFAGAQPIQGAPSISGDNPTPAGFMPNLPGKWAARARKLQHQSGPTPRSNDNDLAILDWTENFLQAQPDREATLRVFSKNEMCPSCQAVLAEFQVEYPRVNVEFYYVKAVRP